VNAVGTSPQGRNQRGRPRRASIVIGLSALAGVIACTLLVAFGAEAVVSRASCTDHPVVLKLAASPDIAPAASHVAKYFNAQHNDVQGHCAVVHVSSVRSSVAATEITKSATNPAFQAWIPDSSLWVNVARSFPVGVQLVQQTGLTVARSPLMIAMPRSVAAQVPAYGSSVGWQFLLPQRVGGPATGLGLHVEFPDPAQSSAGLATLITLQQLLGTGSTAQAGFADFVLNVQVTSGSGTLTSLASLAQRDERPVTIASEQAIAQFDRAHPAADALSGRYPVQGTPELNYPYALTSANQLERKVGLEFEKAMRSSYASSYVQYLGFRTGAGAAPGWIGQYGLDTGQPKLTAAPAPGEAETSLQAWQKLSLGSRDLVLLDVSEQMATPVSPTGTTLEQVLIQAASLGLTHFPDSTQMGIWAFASHLDGSLAYKQLVPVGPLPAPLGLITRRQQITQATQQGKPVAGAPAALYSSILAAFKSLSAGYQPRYVNAVLVLTAGIDNDKGDMSAASLIRQLRALYNPNKRVEIVPLMFGTAGNFKALQQVAKVTGGVAFDITSPKQINGAFFSGIAQRLSVAG
jgi:Bacterial extracellular solute-binding protein